MNEDTKPKVEETVAGRTVRVKITASSRLGAIKGANEYYRRYPYAGYGTSGGATAYQVGDNGEWSTYLTRSRSAG